MSVTVLSSQPRVLYHSLTWPESPFLQIPSLASATLRNLSALEGSQTVKNTPRSSSMKLTRPSETRRFGLLHISEEVYHVPEHGRTSGDGSQTDAGNSEANTECYSGGTLDAILSEMIIVVPCKDEELSVIRGVISAIPAPCLVILVSNCQRQSDDDDYLQQVDMVKAFGGDKRQLLAIHQKDAAAAAAFKESGMAELCGPDGTIRDGKGEGIILGVALAAALCPARRYIGFVDADNLRAGSVHEYCLAFAAGFAMSLSRDREDTMVRLKWASKPKLRDNGRVELVKEGRCSRIVNSWLNKLFAAGDGQGSDGRNTNFITTGNAGEHAMSMGLALKLRMAAGYAIEPYHFVDLLERAYLSPSRVTQGSDGVKNQPQPLERPVRIVQIQTLSPHYHRETDNDHIRRMWAAGLGSVFHGLATYHSRPGSDDGEILKLRQELQGFAVEHRNVDDITGELPRPRVYSALEDTDLRKFRKIIEPSTGKGSLRAFGFAGDKQA